MGAGVEYVSGRTRAKGEMNGKSANLNNCLTQIYPEGTIIPHNELVSFLGFSLLPGSSLIPECYGVDTLSCLLKLHSALQPASNLSILLASILEITVISMESHVRERQHGLNTS